MVTSVLKPGVDAHDISLDDGDALQVATDWKPGMSIAVVTFDHDRTRAIKVQIVPGGYRLRYRGADLKVWVRSPRAAELAALMPVKLPPDTSKFLLCPMPGLLTRINVAAGEEVQDGQALATVEAMKMENILRAERKGVVKAIRAEVGQSLTVDQVILEFD